MPEIFYIRKDPYSKGGTLSEGSFRIKHPDGFATYFLKGDLEYRSWEKENQINYLPVSNSVRVNPLHEPEDWEAFQAEPIRCSEELYPGRVSNLTFEKYHMEVSRPWAGVVYRLTWVLINGSTSTFIICLRRRGSNFKLPVIPLNNRNAFVFCYYR